MGRALLGKRGWILVERSYFGVPAPDDQQSFAEPERRIMKHARGSFEQSYNAHTAVDVEPQIIVAAELTNIAVDSAKGCAVDRLPPLFQADVDSTGDPPQQALADAGFRSEAASAKVVDVSCEVTVALGREGREQPAIGAAKYPRSAARSARL